jgi:hypothetical protein
MIATIIFLVMTLLITLDSIGSKRLRAKVIRLGKHFFAEAGIPNYPLTEQDLPQILQRYLQLASPKEAAPIQNLRLKIKGAVQIQGRKSWTPIEAKQFLTTQPDQMLHYEDRTLAFLVSQKIFRQLTVEQNLQRKAVLSNFPQKNAPAIINQMYRIAMITWQPNWFLINKVEWEASEAGELLTKLGSIEVKFRFDGTTGQLISSECVDIDSGASIKYEYSDFEETESYLVPMRFEVTESYPGKQFQYRFQVTGLIYNEDFAWW